MDSRLPSHPTTSNVTTDSTGIYREYTPGDLLNTIDWVYFFFAWGISPEHPQAAPLRREAETMLRRIADEGTLARAAGSWRRAWSEGDDIVLPATETESATRLCFLRQQHARPDAPCLCLADFIAPPTAAAAPPTARSVGLFATAVANPADTVPHPPGCPCCNPLPTGLRRRTAPTPANATPDGDDPYTTMMRQTLLDRLAEAAAAHIHAEMLQTFGNETVNTEVRPAVGYPSMPDQSLIFDIAPCLPFDRLGITLTHNGMMLPHAATCGLVFAHPAARYFDVGHVGADQLEDYARRRGTDAADLQRFMTRRLA